MPKIIATEAHFEHITFHRETLKYYVLNIGEPRFSELDPYSMLWNGHYVNYFEHARQLLGRYTQLNTDLLEEYGFRIPIYSYNLKMRNPVSGNDQLRVAVRPVGFKKGLLEFFHIMLVGNEIRATGNTIHAVVDIRTRSITYPLPDLVVKTVERVFEPFKNDKIEDANHTKKPLKMVRPKDLNSTDGTNAPLIELKEVTKDYHLGETRVAALKRIDLTIAKGEFAAVWGPSGSGKSTLCNLIGLTDNPTSGKLIFRDRDTTSLSDDEKSDERNSFIGFIFQNFNLIPVLTALDNVILPLQIRGEAITIARKKAQKLMADLGIADYMRHRPQKLSGGQQQRVAIARALITEPSLVIADEPTANLDSDNALKIIDLMRDINQKNGTTFVFSTHDQRLLDRVKRQINLQDGQIVNESRPAAA